MTVPEMMEYPPIESYGVIGDLHTVALVEIMETGMTDHRNGQVPDVKSSDIGAKLHDFSQGFVAQNQEF